MKETLNDIVNQMAMQAMKKEACMGLRKISYEDFKRRARAHQVKFREDFLTVHYDEYENVLTPSDAAEGLIFYEGFRKEIMAGLQKPVPKTSARPGGPMLANLLRSEHIPYNIFFPMKKDLAGTGKLFNKILGTDEIRTVDDILIEYHPEPIEEYLNDHTAFDVYIAYTDTVNRACGIGIEVKYTESGYSLKPNSAEYRHVKDEHGNTRLFEPYASATKGSGYYKDGIRCDTLVSNKFRQVWRNHILGASMVLHGDIAKFTSITLFPRENVHFFIKVMPEYKKMLSDEGYGTCIPLTYEFLFECMSDCLNLEGKDDWIKYLEARYLINRFAELFTTGTAVGK